MCFFSGRQCYTQMVLHLKEFEVFYFRSYFRRQQPSGTQGLNSIVPLVGCVRVVGTWQLSPHEESERRALWASAA